MTTENPNADWYAMPSASEQGMVADQSPDSDGRTVALTYDPNDAPRIAACLNACRGIPTDWLERQPDFMQCLVGWCLDFCAEHRGSLTDDEIRDGLADLLTESFGFDLSDPHVAPAWTDRREIRRAATD